MKCIRKHYKKLHNDSFYTEMKVKNSIVIEINKIFNENFEEMYRSGLELLK